MATWCVLRSFVPKYSVLPVLVLLCALSGFAADFGKVTTEKVTEGVYRFSVSDYGDVGLSGNSIAIISSKGVLVFDTTGTPATARVIVAEIKKLTSRPVRYVVNSHWHWDHWGGNQVFKTAFPDVQIISQEKTRELMMHDSIEWNRDYLARDIPDHIKQIEEALAKKKSSGGSPDRIARLVVLLEADRDFLQQKRSLTNTFPDQVFSESMKIFLGGTEIDLFHARAITPGDAFVYLPKERILITGDILVHPIPFAIGGTYPSAWLQALHRLKALDPQTIIPGHGPVQRDQGFLDANLELFQKVLDDVQHAKASGLSLEQTTQQLKKNVAGYATILNLGEKSYESVDGLFLQGIIKNAYLEIDHPLSDTPAR
jgi:cyclase